MLKRHDLQAVSRSVKTIKSYRENNMAHLKKPLAVALGAAFLASSFAPLVSAEVNPFSAQQLSGGYDLAHYGKDGEGKCGEGKCGEGKKAEGEGKKAKGEGKCGEGKCGEGKKSEGEGKCGEGKCGG
jgi:uncharacterized low-complexity protein